MAEVQIQAPIPQDLHDAMRLESIFMPRAREQRDELFGNEPRGNDPRFVHYTSAENALSIIRTKRLWMRNTTCMSDYREVQHGFDILAKFFSDKPRLDAFCKALGVCAPGVALEAVNLFNQWWNNICFNTYIASISEHDSKKTCTGVSPFGVLSEITPLALLSCSGFLGFLEGERPEFSCLAPSPI